MVLWDKSCLHQTSDVLPKTAGTVTGFMWLPIVTQNPTTGTDQRPAQFEWREVTKVAHYYLSVDALRQPMQVREESHPFGEKKEW